MSTETGCDPRPALSVVIATSQPWPELRSVLDSVYSQARMLGAELVIVDGHGDGLPREHGYAGARVLRRPGLTVFRARALGLAEATGEIVAVTEDHCRVAPDWCEAVLRAHAACPEAAMIGGVVENGATESLWDWANFLISNGPFLPPIPVGERPDICGQANISYKRWALPTDSMSVDGLQEAEHKSSLRAAGRALVNDDRIVVAHVQELGALGSCLIHFHDGRASAGFARSRHSRRERLGRILHCCLMPIIVFAGASRIVGRILVRKPAYRRVALLSWPLVVVVLAFHIGGGLLGHLFGPGESPSRLR